MERKLQSLIEQDPKLKAKYGNLLRDIDAVYKSMSLKAFDEANFQNMRLGNQMLRFAYTVYDAAVERQKSRYDVKSERERHEAGERERGIRHDAQSDPWFGPWTLPDGLQDLVTSA